MGGGVLAFGDRMGGLGEQLARDMVERLAPSELAFIRRTNDQTFNNSFYLSRALSIYYYFNSK